MPNHQVCLTCGKDINYNLRFCNEACEDEFRKYMEYEPSKVIKC